MPTYTVPAGIIDALGGLRDEDPRPGRSLLRLEGDPAWHPADRVYQPDGHDSDRLLPRWMLWMPNGASRLVTAHPVSEERIFATPSAPTVATLLARAVGLEVEPGETPTFLSTPTSPRDDPDPAWALGTRGNPFYFSARAYPFRGNGIHVPILAGITNRVHALAEAAVWCARMLRIAAEDGNTRGFNRADGQPDVFDFEWVAAPHRGGPPSPGHAGLGMGPLEVTWAIIAIEAHLGLDPWAVDQAPTPPAAAPAGSAS